jgi:hypothetical protein
VNLNSITQNNSSNLIDHVERTELESIQKEPTDYAPRRTRTLEGQTYILEERTDVNVGNFMLMIILRSYSVAVLLSVVLRTNNYL